MNSAAGLRYYRDYERPYMAMICRHPLRNMSTPHFPPLLTISISILGCGIENPDCFIAIVGGSSRGGASLWLERRSFHILSFSKQYEARYRIVGPYCKQPLNDLYDQATLQRDGPSRAVKGAEYTWGLTVVTSFL
jgi:hypothetical protein